MTTKRVEIVDRIVGYRRLDSGRRVRAAMSDRGLTIAALAAKTREADPSGVGVNWRVIGFLVSEGRSGRDTCTTGVAELVAKALDVPLTLLFEARTTRVVRVHGVSTYSRIEVDTA